MGQPRHRLHFAEQAGLAAGRVVAPHLDRDVAPEPGVAGAVHDAHAAHAEPRDDLEPVAEEHAGRQRG